MVKCKLLAIAIILLSLQNVFSQNVTNTLGFADPKFNKDELELLSTNNGCYLETIEYIGGSFYQGSGFIQLALYSV